MSPDALMIYLCRHLFDQHYRLTVTMGEVSMILELRVDPAMVSRAIGHHGAMITALRHLAEACGAKHGLRVYVSLDEV